MAWRRLNLSSSRGIRQSLSRIANMLLNEEIKPKTANTILYACNIGLNNAIRVDEQQGQYFLTLSEQDVREHAPEWIEKRLKAELKKVFNV